MVFSPSSSNSGKRLTQFYEKHKRGRGGVRRESSLQLKRSAISFKVSFREAGLSRSQGQREKQPQGRDVKGLHLMQVQQGLVQHPLCTEMLLLGALQFIFQVINGLLQFGY